MVNVGKCITLPETNITPENGWLEDEISFWDGLFSGAFAVSFREGKPPDIHQKSKLFGHCSPGIIRMCVFFELH